MDRISAIKTLQTLDIMKQTIPTARVKYLRGVTLLGFMHDENWTKIGRDFGRKMDIKLTITIIKDEMDSVNIIINV